jgi:hypothetical protein
MPLEPGSSQAAIGKNIATERRAGKPEDQAIAIAESEARRTKHAKGDDLAERVQKALANFRRRA